MSIIKRRPKENLKPVSFRLPESLIERLSAFADFTNVPQSEIVMAALNHVIDSDKDFAEESSKAGKTSERAAHAASNTRRGKAAGETIAESNTERSEGGSRLKAVTA
jgi:predicted DNA-binding protein